MKATLVILAVLLCSGIQTISAEEKNDFQLKMEAQQTKQIADLRSGAQKDGNVVVVHDGSSHLVEAHGGCLIERDYRASSLSVSSNGGVEDGVVQQTTTVRGDNNKLLETLEWNGKIVTIKDASGKLIETKKF